MDIQRNNNWKNAADSYRFYDLLRNFEGKSLEEFQNEIDEKKRRAQLDGKQYWGFNGHDSVESNKVHNHCAELYIRMLYSL